MMDSAGPMVLLPLSAASSASGSSHMMERMVRLRSLASAPAEAPVRPGRSSVGACSAQVDDAAVRSVLVLDDRFRLRRAGAFILTSPDGGGG